MENIIIETNKETAFNTALNTLKEWFNSRSVLSCELYMDSYDGLFVVGNLSISVIIVYGDPTGGQQTYDLSKVTNPKDKSALKVVFKEFGIPFRE